MSDFEQWASNDSAPWLPVNQNFEAIAGTSIYARNRDTESGLVYGLMGGVFKDTTKAATTTTLADATTNYIVAALSDGTISDATTTTNWDDDATYARVAKVTTAGGAITAVVDYRFDEFGLFAMLASGAGASTVELKGLTFTSDTGSTADSDPGNGLFKWNNATQSSATQIYIDNQTADSVSITEYWSDLPATGYLFIQQGDNSAKWQLWAWSAVSLAAGYFKLTVSLKGASATAIDDAKTCYLNFDADANTGSSSTQGKHSVPIMAPAIIPSAAGGCASIAVSATTANHPDLQYLAFDSTTQEFAQFSIAMPKSWNEGTITASFIWTHPSTVTNFGVRWGLQAVAVSDDDTIDVAYGTAQEVTDTGGTTSDHYRSAETSAITVGGTPAAEDTVYFRVYRDPTNGGDTMAVDGYLLGVVIHITTSADTDA